MYIAAEADAAKKEDARWKFYSDLLESIGGEDSLAYHLSHRIEGDLMRPPGKSCYTVPLDGHVNYIRTSHVNVRVALIGMLGKLQQGAGGEIRILNTEGQKNVPKAITPTFLRVLQAAMSIAGLECSIDDIWNAATAIAAEPPAPEPYTYCKFKATQRAHEDAVTALKAAKDALGYAEHMADLLADEVDRKQFSKHEEEIHQDIQRLRTLIAGYLAVLNCLG